MCGRWMMSTTALEHCVVVHTCYCPRRNQCVYLRSTTTRRNQHSQECKSQVDTVFLCLITL